MSAHQPNTVAWPHAARSHRELLEDLVARARQAFGGRWDPRPDRPDAGLGLLDVVAAALHVLWTYQEAWADEGFLGPAALERSTRRLLAQVGYTPPTGTAALGLQHFHLKAGLTATLPAGFRVRSAPLGDEEEASFRTLGPIEADAWLNELRAFLPPGDPAPGTTGAVDAVLGTGDALGAFAVPGLVPAAGSAASPADLLGQLEQRLAANRQQNAAQRAARQARQRARQIAATLTALGDPPPASCTTGLCEELCDAVEASVEADGLAGPLSESQEALAAMLRRLQARQPDAVDALGRVLQRGACESVEEWAQRLDAMTGFLDAFVAGLMQQGRDHLVRLQGPAALQRLDRAYRDGAAGVALPGTTRFWVPLPVDADGQPVSLVDRLQRGAWLILGEEQLAPDGTSTRRWREAVRVVTVRDDTPEGQTSPMVEVTFEPPLRWRHPLSTTVILGNNAVVAHGTPVRARLPAPFGAPAPLQAPLGFVLDPAATDGRRPLLEVTVNGVGWAPIVDLRFAGPADRVFAVEATDRGEHQLRLGDGRRGARPPEGAVVELSYSVGTGVVGNRAAGRVQELVDSHPSVESTTNPLPIAGGAEPELQSLGELKAGVGIHGLDRAVSVSDVRTLALGHAGVQDAVVFRDPSRRRETVRVVATADRGEPLSAEGLELLRLHLQARVPSGVRIRVDSRTAVPLRARLRLMLAPGADPFEVLARVRDVLGLGSAADGLLHPDRVRLGVDVHVSEIYRWLGAVPGLSSSLVEALHRADRPASRADRVEIGRTELAVWATGEHEPVDLVWETL